ncbi:centrosomal protein of 41 kDa-like [Genypterus blacodes]|uniref:centrosomal protein of 41 kDa-like n=1 Tax=Genypterus blacodes TaxID=154954 RepID=UPI003F7728FD
MSDQTIGNPQCLEKLAKKNPKYEHIKSKLDTGPNLSNFVEKKLKTYLRYSKEELFKRMKVTALAKLMLQVASIAELEENEPGKKQPDPGVVSVQPSCFHRSTLQSVICGVGELDLKSDMQNAAKETLVPTPDLADRPYPDCPYLLLDVRDDELYDHCHIISSHSYPTISLCRIINPYTKEVLDYRNAMGKIIILYDEDEKLATQAATIMCQRGFENLYVLSGGLKAVARKFPRGMTTGSFPAACLLLPVSKGKKCCKVQPPPQPAETRQRFTSDELSILQQRLEEMNNNSNTSSKNTQSF